MTPKPQTHNGDLTQLPNALAFLRDQKVWVCWRWFWNGKKWTKPPYRADNANINASTSNPDTWGTYEQALAQVHTGTADGIGIALSGRDIGGIDLDHCCDPVTGEIADWAHEYLVQFPGAYAEVTVSGAGLRILGTSPIPNFARKFKLPLGNGEAVELFSNSTHYLSTSFNQIKICDVLPPIGNGMTAIATTLGGGALLNGADQKLATLDSAIESPPIAPTNEPPQPWTFAEETRVRLALASIPANEQILGVHFGHSHDAWVKIGRALAWLGWGERGYGIFRDWSSQSTSEFNEKGLRTQWASFERTRNTRADPITIGTVYYFAQQLGWSDSQQASDNSGVEPPTPKRLKWVDMSNWDHEPIPEREWAIFNRVPLNQAGLFSGEGGTGKSIIELEKDVAHVAGKSWLGSMPVQGPAFYIGAEDDVKEIHIRLAVIAQHYATTFKALIEGGLHVQCLLGEDATLCAATGKSGKVEITGLYREIYQAAGDLKPKNISVDTLSRAFAGNEIDRVQVYAFAQHMQALAMVAQGSVTVLSHPSLQGISSGSGIGSTAWHGAFRFRQYLKGIKATDGEPADNDLREARVQEKPVRPDRRNNGPALPARSVPARRASPTSTSWPAKPESKKSSSED
jgi:AAA domain/Primase C terminal 2 (PriCT-2)